MAGQYYDTANARLQLKEFGRLKGDSRLKSLKKLAEGCADELPKFKNFRCEEVVLATLTSLKIPRKRFNIILGHEDIEEALYPALMKRLRETFDSAEVFNTSHVRSSFVRFADFSVLKRGIMGKKILSFDAKTKPTAFDHFLNQAQDFKRFSDEVYLIATPALVLEAGKKFESVAYAESAVVDKLRQAGVGLYVFDKTSGRFVQSLEAQKGGTNKEAKSKAIEELQLL